MMTEREGSFGRGGRVELVVVRSLVGDFSFSLAGGSSATVFRVLDARFWTLDSLWFPGSGVGPTLNQSAINADSMAFCHERWLCCESRVHVRSVADGALWAER